MGLKQTGTNLFQSTGKYLKMEEEENLYYKCNAVGCGLIWLYESGEIPKKCCKCGSKDIEKENGKGK